MPTTHSAFQQARFADVVRELRRGSGPNLCELLHALPGYWPAGVVEDLEQIALAVPDLSQQASQILTDLDVSAKDPDSGDEVRRLLPVPHLLDADWRFTIRTRELLLEIAESHSPRRETLLLGTPSIFVHMCSQLDLRGAVLIDASPATIEAAKSLSAGHARLRAQQADLLSGVNIGLPPEFDTVIADPPWYFAEHRAFLDAASSLLALGGVALMAAAPRGTRPDALNDRAELLAHAEAAGFDLIDTHWGGVEYTSSPFERAALRASGLASVPTNWRRADLLIFRKSARVGPSALVESVRPSGWIDRFVGRTRVKLHGGHPPLSSERDHFDGTVCASVSRLAPERETANLWTSGNGTFNVDSVLINAIVEGDPRWRTTNPGAALLGVLEDEAADLRRWGWT